MARKIKLHFVRSVLAAFLVIAQWQLAKCQAPSSTSTSSAKHKLCHECTCIPGIPGTHGIPGTPGTAGLPGKDCLSGSKGDPGVPGPVGPRGFKGVEGKTGQTGFPGKPGKPGYPGKTGPRGKPGFSGPAGVRGPRGFPGLEGIQGNKGEPGLYNINWHHCVWNRNDQIFPKTTGTFVQGCNFTKSHQNTPLKVSFQGNLGGRHCKRWYFKFNDQECSGPAPIEALVYTAGSLKTNHHFIQGLCTNLPAGPINIALWVQDCPGELQKRHPAYAGNMSHSTIFIEEVQVSKP